MYYDSNIADVAPADALQESPARSALFSRVVSYMNGRAGVRSEVLVYMCSLLNAGITPLIAKRGGDGPATAKAVLGAGSCLFRGEVR